MVLHTDLLRQRAAKTGHMSNKLLSINIIDFESSDNPNFIQLGSIYEDAMTNLVEIC